MVVEVLIIDNNIRDTDEGVEIPPLRGSKDDA